MSTRLAPRPRSDGSASPLAAGGGRPPAARLRILVLYAFSRCDCRCRMCDIWRETESRSLEPEAVAAELPAWREAGLERVVLSGGESLLHPHPERLLAALRDLPVTLLSSGISLAPNAALIAASSIDEVIVSLDGPKALHERIRGRADAFTRLAEGVAALRREAGGLRIGARCTVQAANLSHLRATVAQARDLGLDGISFLAVDAHSAAFNRGGSAVVEAPGLLPDARGLEDLERELAAMEALDRQAFAEGFIVEGPEKLRRRLLEHFRAELGQGERPGIRCNAPWVSAVVEADGRLRPCFFHQAVAAWRPGEVPLLEAFHGAAATAFREGLQVPEDDLCRRCVCNLNLV